MAASLGHFLNTGQLGPLTLGMKPSEVQILLGEPDAQSRKLNPLLLKYGPLEMTFVGTKPQPPQLVQMTLSFTSQPGSLPDAISTEDWLLSPDTTVYEFNRVLNGHGIEPAEIVPAHQVILPSGVKAVFYLDRLKQLGISRRDTDDNRTPTLMDSREASPDAIRAQLGEVRAALRSGLVSAALMLVWAALEASMRRAAIRAGVKGQIGVQPSVLIRELYAAGRLTSEEVSLLESARQLRTSVAHGLATKPIEVSLVHAVDGIARRLLEASEPPIAFTDAAKGAR